MESCWGGWRENWGFGEFGWEVGGVCWGLRHPPDERGTGRHLLGIAVMNSVPPCTPFITPSPIALSGPDTHKTPHFANLHLAPKHDPNHALAHPQPPRQPDQVGGRRRANAPSARLVRLWAGSCPPRAQLPTVTNHQRGRSLLGRRPNRLETRAASRL